MTEMGHEGDEMWRKRKPNLQDVIDRLDETNRLLRILTEKNETEIDVATAQEILDKLAQVQEETAANTDATNAAASLLANLAQMIRDAGTDQVALQAIADALDSTDTTLQTNNATLADAIAANTPVNPAT